MAWNPAAVGRDGVPEGGTVEVTACGDRAATNKAGATEWGGVGVTAACSVVVVWRDVASAGWSKDKAAADGS